MSIEAMKLALAALDEATTYTGSPSWSPSMTDECIAAASALRAALAQQPATPEPVAHLWQHAETGRTRIVMSGDVWTANDRWCYVGPLVLGDTHPAPSVPATPEPVKAERDQLRYAQADAVLPLIGPLLDAWENSDREVMSQEPELSKQLKNINSAMEDAQPATGEPVAWAVLTKSGKLHSAHSRRESAESRLDRWRKKQADAGLMYWACRVAPLYTHPAPSVPDDVVRDAERLNDLEALVKSKGMHGLSFDYCRHVEDGYVVEKGFRLMWRHTLCERKPTLREAIDAAMLAAKDAK